MLKKGDELKIIEDIPHNKQHKKRTTIGIVEQITNFNIVLKRIHHEESTHNVCFNIADCRDISKHFFKKDNGAWMPIKIKVTEHQSGEKRHGSKYD